MKPGKSYRTVVKFCAEDLCFPVVYGNGNTVLYNPPVGGEIKVDLQDRTHAKQQVWYKKNRNTFVILLIVNSFVFL